MTTAMRHYEVMVILDPNLEERTIAPSLDAFLYVVKKDGGTVEKVDIWGRRRLAYEIDKHIEGIYAVDRPAGQARPRSRSSTASSTSTSRCCGPRSCARTSGNAMAGETVITVVGNLTADPELRFTPSGAAVASFTIASTPRTFDRNTNEWKDGEALFLRCSIWRQAAENVAESLQRGMRVVAQGRLKQRSYETREGEKRTVIELDVDEVGPSLKYATAKVNRTQRGSSSGGGFGASGSRRRPAGAGAERRPVGLGPSAGGGGGGFSDEPPF